MLTYIFGIITGIAQPTQTSVNSALRMRLRSPYLASMSSFGTSAAAISILIIIINHCFYLPIADIVKEPVWIWCGGLCGAVIVLMCILCLPKLGSVETVILTVLGLITAGLAIDNYGLFKSTVIKMTGMRVLGALLVILGAVIVSRRLGQRSMPVDKPDGDKLSAGERWLYRLAALAVGMASGVQFGINGRLGTVVGSSLKAAFVSMSVGFIVMSLVTLIILISKGHSGVIDESMPIIKGKWWMWTGGLIAIVIVGGSTMISQLLGPGMASVLSIIGQTAGGAAIDATGFLGIDKKPITANKIIGIIIMIAGATLVQLF